MSHSVAGHTEEHAHPSWQLYVGIAVILFVLTALEVGAYEVAERGIMGGFGVFVKEMVVEILLVLSAVKFALVAMFYMHLKQDSKIFSGLFVFPIILAIGMILALLGLFVYNRGENAFWNLMPWS